MRRRSWLPFIVLNVIISAGVAFGLFSVLQQQNPTSQNIPSTPLVIQVVVTSTVDPNATIPVRVITATPFPGTIIAGSLPTGLVEPQDLTNNPAPTIDPNILGESEALQLTATALPPGCILHTMADGEFPSSIAEVYGANLFDMMELNGLDDESATFLQIGDVLIVPLEGCPLTTEDVVAQVAVDEATPEDETEGTEDAPAESTDEPTVAATLTLPPTAEDAQVEIVEVLDAGDVTAEGVVIRNSGGTVDITGWTLTDSQGNEFTFPEQLLFSNASVTVFTRVGQDTPVVLFWGQNEPVWGEPGDVVTLADADGVVQSVLRLDAPVDLD
jgi:hypothetical protein